jgi:imidazoleglycerol-phosphate dehydratase
VLCALDLCGRPYLVYNLALDREKVGDLETEMVREFFYAVSYGAQMNLHIKQLDGTNNHHIIEAAFKAFAKALDGATSLDPRITDVLSTKGSL